MAASKTARDQFNANTVHRQQNTLNLGTCGPTQCAREKPQQIDSCMRKKPTDNLASTLHKIVHTELCARKQ